MTAVDIAYGLTLAVAAGLATALAILVEPAVRQVRTIRRRKP